MGTRQFEAPKGQDCQNRRDSIIVAENRIRNALTDGLNELRQIWDLVGMNEDQRQERMDTAILHIENLLSEMVGEERQMHEALTQTVHNYGKEIYALSRDLQERVDELNENVTLLEAEDILRCRLEELRKEKQYRLKTYKELHDQDVELSVKLSTTPFYLPQNSSSVPTNEQLDAMRQHVEKSKAEAQQNAAKLKYYCTGIQMYVKKLNYTLKTDVEKQICCSSSSSNFSNSESKDFTNLSRDFVKQAEEFHNKLKESYETYLDDIKRRMNDVKSELETWFDKCHVSDVERRKFVHVTEENFDEIALKRYNAEIDRLKAYYTERQEILEKVAAWKRMWDEKLAYEDKDKDSYRLLNRGGALLQEEKTRKKLDKQLLAVRSEIKCLVTQWSVDHPTEPIQFDGLPVIQRLDKYESDYRLKKELEKNAKQAAKKQQVEAERLYGVSPGTPTKRPIRGAILKRTPTPPANQNATSSSHSRHYVHSSLAATRSPSGWRAVTRAIAANNNGNVVDPACGLPPKPVTAANSGKPVPSKRKALLVDDRPCMPLSSMNQQNNVEPVGADASFGSTTSSGTYRDFAAQIREKGADGQSSFIVVPQHAASHHPSSTPSKMPRL